MSDIMLVFLQSSVPSLLSAHSCGCQQWWTYGITLLGSEEDKVDGSQSEDYESDPDEGKLSVNIPACRFEDFSD